MITRQNHKRKRIRLPLTRLLVAIVASAGCFSVLIGWRMLSGQKHVALSHMHNADSNITSKKESRARLKRLTFPVINVGWPKSGSTSLYQFFRCNNLRAQHFCCCGETSNHPPCQDMASCILRNLGANQTILRDCGDYDVYAQIDGERRTRAFRKGRGVLLENASYHVIEKRDQTDLLMHFLPQVFFLEELHAAAPEATYILPLRPPEDWTKSVMNWFNTRGRIVNEFRHFNNTLERPGKAGAKEFLVRVYLEQIQRIRSFVQKYPSHSLVEVNITDASAGEQLAAHFGLDASCWGHHNKIGSRAKPRLDI